MLSTEIFPKTGHFFAMSNEPCTCLYLLSRIKTSAKKNRPEKSPGGPNFLLHIQFFVFLYEEQISSRPADTDPCRTEPQRKPDP